MTRHFFSLISLSAGLLVVPPLVAQPSALPGDGAPLTLSRAFEMAIRTNERLDIQAEEIEQAKARYRQVRAGVRPDVRFNLEHRIQDEPPASSDGDSADRATERTESKIELRQPIFQGFREFHALASLRANENRERLQFKREATLLYQDVATAFFNVVEIETELADLRTLMKLSVDRLGELRQRADLGKTRMTDVVTADSQLAIFRAREAALIGDLFAAREFLSFLIGEAVGSRPVVDDLPDPAHVPPVEDMVARARDRSDVAALGEEVLARRAGIRVANASYWPSVVASGNYYLKRPPGFQEEIEWDALLTVDMPIYRGGAGSALRMEAKSLLRQAERDFARLSRFAETDVRRSHAFLTSSIEEARLLEDAGKKARRAYELLSKDYRVGLANNLDVLASMNTFQQVKRDHDLSRLQAKLDLLNLHLAAEMAPDTLP